MRTRSSLGVLIPLVLLCVPAALAACGNADDDGGGDLQWYTTCGDPVCGGHTPTPGATPCSDEQAGAACGEAGARCEIPGDDCNADLLCTDTDPATNCPISRAAFKREIQYLDDAGRAAAASALLDLRLATYRYRGARDDGRDHLGFVIDDLPARSPAVAADGQRVDLYGYTSMTVAALQAQAAQVQRLQAEVDALRRELAALRPAAPVCEPAARP
jgi:hypothetical protein